jgi:hypothetical protein
MIEQIQEALIKHPELIKQEHRDLSGDPLYGHCYVGCEVYYHLRGKEQGYVPYCMRIVGNVTHWFLKHRTTGSIIDIIKPHLPYEYTKGYHVPFLSVNPSKRAQVIFKEMGL